MMNFINRALAPLLRISSQSLKSVILPSRSISFLSLRSTYNLPQTSEGLLSLGTLTSQQQIRTYKERTVLKRRCAGCYFVKRFGRLYVECDLKPRHKQRQKVYGLQNYKDDYSKGKWKKAIHWNYEKKDVFYKQGHNQFAKYRWLDGKLGSEI